MDELKNEILCGDAYKVLQRMPEQSIDCCVTSPPYWRMRDYGVSGQIGLEKNVDDYINKLAIVFREVKRVLKEKGTLWLNIGDTYAGSWRGMSGKLKQHSEYIHSPVPAGLKPKDLIGIPWKLAFTLQKEGWYLRSDIIWQKTNPMPESVRDRPTKAHEYIFLMSKNKKYYYDYEAIKEHIKYSTMIRLAQNIDKQKGSDRIYGGTVTMKSQNVKCREYELAGLKRHCGNYDSEGCVIGSMKKNKRSVWFVATESFKDKHFAVFPEKLIEPCIKAGCPEGGIVLDPFIGSGTTGIVAVKNNRYYTGIDLNPAYIELAKKRIAQAIRKSRHEGKIEKKIKN